MNHGQHAFLLLLSTLFLAPKCFGYLLSPTTVIRSGTCRYGTGSESTSAGVADVSAETAGSDVAGAGAEMNGISSDSGITDAVLDAVMTDIGPESTLPNDATQLSSDDDMILSNSIDKHAKEHKYTRERVIYPPPPSPALDLASRRVWLTRVAGAVAVGGSAVTGAAVYRLNKASNSTSISRNTAPKRLAPVNLTQTVRETRVNITIQCTRTCVSLDSKTFQKKQSLKLPHWFPPYLIPQPVVVKDIPNSEVLAAAILAGSAVEMIRTALLYPLQTLKARIQTDVNRRERYTPLKSFRWKRRIRILRLNIVRHMREGQLYAGLLPSLLVSVPATGVYYGARDIVRRMLLMVPPIGSSSIGGTAAATGEWNELSLSLTAALLADVISLVFRTPADTLAVRLQVATAESARDTDETVISGIKGVEDSNGMAVVVDSDITDDNAVAEALADALQDARVDETVGDWFGESLQRLPAVIATDLPYLLSRIVLNGWIGHGQTMDLGRYEVMTFGTAVVCAFLTTPFDVARTRVLVDSDDDVSNGKDGGSGHGLIETFRIVVNEGDGGVRNLFAGWLERTAYLGISSLWLPFALLLYTAIRDTILLEWFD